MRKITAIILSVLCLLVFSRASSFAATVIISPSQDTYVYSGAVNATNGNSQDMVSFWDQLNGNQGLVLMKFPMDQIPANAVINSATLTLYQNDSSGIDHIWLVAMKVTSDWNNNVTWATKPGWEPGFSDTSVDLSLSYKTWDLKKMVQGWMDGSIHNYGIYLMPPGLGNNVYNRSFSTSRDHQLNRRPTLTVDYSIPAAGGINFRITPIVLHISPIIAQAGNGAGDAALTVSDVVSEVNSSSQATISWKTNKNSSSYVYYGNSQDGVNRFDKQAGQNDSVISHQVKISNLLPNNKYSFKAASVDATAQTTYSPISFFQTASNQPIAALITPTPEESGNLVSSVQNGVENKVAEYVIQQSTPSSQTKSSSGDTDSKNLSTGNPLVMIAAWTGTNRMAGIIMIILGILSLIGAYIVFETGRRVHRQVKRRLKKKR